MNSEVFPTLGLPARATVIRLLSAISVLPLWRIDFIQKTYYGTICLGVPNFRLYKNVSGCLDTGSLNSLWSLVLEFRSISKGQVLYFKVMKNIYKNPFKKDISGFTRNPPLSLGHDIGRLLFTRCDTCPWILKLYSTPPETVEYEYFFFF